ncbi:MAG: STAS domain-containing protein [Candidatus Eisenbacteria bacterium]|nr:STAS domain-containing protein [Candidatus Eisenbacteria bacterium]
MLASRSSRARLGMVRRVPMDAPQDAGPKREAAMAWLRGKLEITRTEHEDPKAVVYALAGPLTDTRECYDLLDDVRGELRDGYLRLVFDLENVVRVTSSGIGLLAACFTSAKNAGGRMSLVAVPEKTRVLLELVHLWDVLDHYPSQAEALAALRETSPE